ncbi:MAG: glycosyltransferase family 2 protein [Gemmatimonadota bacterium]
MIYVCIPVHDEASTVGVLLWKIRKVMGEFGRDYKIVVHDDASGDDTVQVLERYRRALPLTVLRSKERLGYGRSVERLLRHVAEVAPYPKRDCAVVIQGDFTEDPDDMVALIKVLEGGADIVAGHEDGSLQAAPDGARWTRRFAGVFLRGLLRKSPVSDPFAGMRAYRVIVLRKAYRDLADDEFLIRSDGWAANVELLGHLLPHARRVAEAPLNFRYDLRQRPSRFKAFQTCVSLARLRRSVWPEIPSEAA